MAPFTPSGDNYSDTGGMEKPLEYWHRFRYIKDDTPVKSLFYGQLRIQGFRNCELSKKLILSILPQIPNVLTFFETIKDQDLS